MADVTIKFDTKELDNFIKRFPNKFKETINKSLVQSANIVQTRAKIDSPIKSGNLRRSITNDISGFTASIGSNVVYAKVREYNTKRLPNGYLRPALETNANKIKDIFDKNLITMLNRI